MFRAIFFFAAAFFGAAAFFAGPAAAEELDARPVVLMELFTSQGCYSCPPAEELLAAEYAYRDRFLPVEFYADNWDDVILAAGYAPREDILPLELHVDYWDDLIYGLAGSWEDPFSQNAFSERQFAYNRRINNRHTGWTPQMIVHGATSASATRQGQIDAAIAKAQKAKDDGIGWRFSAGEEGRFRATLRGIAQPGGELYYAVFRRRAITEVPSGENKGKTLTNTNVVLELQSRPLSVGRELVLPKLKPGEDCAVWAQNGKSGRVLAAARCPQQTSLL